MIIRNIRKLIKKISQRYTYIISAFIIFATPNKFQNMRQREEYRYRLKDKRLNRKALSVCLQSSDWFICAGNPNNLYFLLHKQDAYISNRYGGDNGGDSGLNPLASTNHVDTCKCTYGRSEG